MLILNVQKLEKKKIVGWAGRQNEICLRWTLRFMAPEIEKELNSNDEHIQYCISLENLLVPITKILISTKKNLIKEFHMDSISLCKQSFFMF